MNGLVNVQIEDSKEYGLVVSSRLIAEQLGKEHSKVIRSLESIISENPHVASQIIESSYKVSGNNKTYKEYLLTKDGFTLYMFNIQGYNDFKMAYINRFNEMEKALLSKTIPSYQIADPIERAQKWIEEEKVRQQLLTENTEMKPKAEFFDDVMDSKTAIDMASVAKVLNMGIGRNKLFQVLRDKKVLQGNNRPYQTYIDRGYFRCVESSYTKANGDTCVNIKTVVFQKGVDFIRKLLQEQ